MKRQTIFCLSFLFASAFCLQAQYAGRTSTEKILAPVGDLGDVQLESVTISPDGRHLAYIDYQPTDETKVAQDELSVALQKKIERETGKKVNASKVAGELARDLTRGARQVVLDGAGQGFRGDVSATHLVFSRDGAHFAYAAGATNDQAFLDGAPIGSIYESIQPAFTADGAKLLCAGRNGWGNTNKDAVLEFVVEVNGRKQKTYQLGGDFSELGVRQEDLAAPFNGNFLCGPKGGRYAYLARNADDFFVVIDGQEEGPYDEVFNFKFSADGKRFAYGATHGKQTFVVIDGQRQTGRGTYVRGSLVFSSDSQHVAYIRHVPGKPAHEFVVHDGVMSREGYPHIRALTFSPDGTQLAFVAKFPNDQECVVVRDQAKKKFPFIAEGPLFSPDGTHVAYRAEWLATARDIVMLDDNQVVVGQGGEKGLWFSPDSRRLASVETLDKQRYLVIDGQRHPLKDEVARFQFSPDSQHWGWTTQNGQLVVDGQTRAVDGYPKTFQFISGGKHWVYIVRKDMDNYVAVDGRLGRAYGRILPVDAPKIHFDSPDKFHYLGIRAGTAYITDESLDGGG